MKTEFKKEELTHLLPAAEIVIEAAAKAENFEDVELEGDCIDTLKMAARKMAGFAGVDPNKMIAACNMKIQIMRKTSS